MYKLPKVELERIENILKRALDVEKGVTEKPSITEEHPDGSKFFFLLLTNNFFYFCLIKKMSVF